MTTPSNGARVMTGREATAYGMLKPIYDVIVCGSGPSGSVVARRLAEDGAIQVLLLEAGGRDDSLTITEAGRWVENLGSAHVWNFLSEPAPELNGRRLQLIMGKVLGGGSSINAMVWSRGHRNDWDYFADATGDERWSYHAVLDVYRRIEDWCGAPDARRGVGGLVEVQPARNHPITQAMIDAAGSIGIPVFDSPNGAMMEEAAGCAPVDIRVRNGKRLSVFDSYVRPVLDRPNLTVLTETLVHRVLFQGRRATGVEILLDGRLQPITGGQVVLSTGAVNTPRILLLSGLGDEEDLGRLGIAVKEHLPGVGRDLQDHTAVISVWEYAEPLAPRDNLVGATLFARTGPGKGGPDTLMCQGQFPLSIPEVTHEGVPSAGWSLFTGLAQPKSRGRVRLTGTGPLDPISITTNALTDPDDVALARAMLALSLDIGDAPAFGPHCRGLAIPPPSRRNDLDRYIRDAAVPFWHFCGTAKMGRDPDAVLNSDLEVRGVENLTVADASAMPRITSGNTMAPCVVIGEQASSRLMARL